MNFLSIILCVLGIISILFIISGYQQSDLEEFSPARYPEAHQKPSKPVEKKTPESCMPGFDCRRVGFYCSLIG